MIYRLNLVLILGYLDDSSSFFLQTGFLAFEEFYFLPQLVSLLLHLLKQHLILLLGLTSQGT